MRFQALKHVGGKKGSTGTRKGFSSYVVEGDDIETHFKNSEGGIYLGNGYWDTLDCDNSVLGKEIRRSL